MDMTTWYVFAGVLTFLYILRCAVKNDFLKTAINYVASVIGIVIGIVFRSSWYSAWLLVGYFVVRIVYALCERSIQRQGLNRTPENFETIDKNIGWLRQIAIVMMGLTLGGAVSWGIREAILQPPVEVGIRPGMLIIFSIATFNVITTSMIDQWVESHKRAAAQVSQYAFSWFMLVIVAFFADVLLHISSVDWS